MVLRVFINQSLSLKHDRWIRYNVLSWHMPSFSLVNYTSIHYSLLKLGQGRTGKLIQYHTVLILCALGRWLWYSNTVTLTTTFLFNPKPSRTHRVCYKFGPRHCHPRKCLVSKNQTPCTSPWSTILEPHRLEKSYTNIIPKSSSKPL